MRKFFTFQAPNNIFKPLKISELTKKAKVLKLSQIQLGSIVSNHQAGSLPVAYLYWLHANNGELF
jgi:hypothetical protein